MELLVCLAYHVCSMFLWYICEQASPSTDTKIVSWPFLRFHCYEIKSVESLVKDCLFFLCDRLQNCIPKCGYALGWAFTTGGKGPTNRFKFEFSEECRISEFLAGWEFIKAIF